MTDAKAITAINDLASTKLDHITRLLAATQRILDGHPAQGFISIARAQIEELGNDIDVLTETAGA